VTTTATPELLEISAAAEQSGLTATALRWYEQEGLLLSPPHRTSSGQRRYDAEHLRWLEMLTRLRGTGMPVADMRRYAELCRAGDGNEAERLALLRAHRVVVLARLRQVQSDLDAIESKVALYEQKVSA
jgi:DNA-binding transcriptional MerR regulator